MARTEDLATRVEQAFEALLEALLPGVEVREYNDDDDDSDTQVAIKAEKEEEELPGTGIWLFNVTVRCRNLTSAQMLTLEGFFRDADSVRQDLAAQGQNAGEFLMPAGNAAVQLRSDWLRDAADTNRTQTIILAVTAQAFETGLANVA